MPYELKLVKIEASEKGIKSWEETIKDIEEIRILNRVAWEQTYQLPGSKSRSLFSYGAPN